MNENSRKNKIIFIQQCPRSFLRTHVGIKLRKFGHAEDSRAVREVLLHESKS
jgi:hypothetical protein